MEVEAIAPLAGDLDAAEDAWRAAYAAALGSRRWDTMLDVGDAYLRAGAQSHVPRVYEAKAREAFLVALFRARREGALDGVVRVGRAFAALGDREVAAHCERLAEDLSLSAREND